MKKLMFSFMAAIMLCAAMPVQIQAADNRAIPSTPRNAPATAETRAMEARLYEIRDMNISAMGKAEKKQLRNEVKAIKSDLKAAGQGVYLSIGAIVLIVLLLILLL